MVFVVSDVFSASQVHERCRSAAYAQMEEWEKAKSDAVVLKVAMVNYQHSGVAHQHQQDENSLRKNWDRRRHCQTGRYVDCSMHASHGIDQNMK